jgi:RNA polymerase sigma-70 factor (ECF subfamily)
MGNDKNNDTDLLEAIRKKDADAWGVLIDQYQGRLLNYAKSKVRQQSDVEDIVQETFISLLNFLHNNPETEIHRLDAYLFGILKNAICRQYRSRWVRSVCLIQDAYYGKDANEEINAAEQITSGDLSVSRFASENEQNALRYQVLSGVLKDVVSKYKKKLNFRDIKMCDLLFYSKMSSVDTASILNQNESSVRVFKHRFLKQVNRGIPEHYKLAENSMLSNANYFSDIWEATQLTCPKYSTLGEFTMETLHPAWFDYIDFHLTTFGCHFCRASYKDIQQKHNSKKQTSLKKSIMTSTIGFFTR